MAELTHPLAQRQLLVCLLIAQVIVIAPLFFYLPLWLGLVWLLAVVIRVQVYRGAWRYPGNFVKAVLGVGSIAGLGLQYGISMGIEPMVGLLVSAFVLKLVEARQRRDFLLMTFIGFVAVAAQFLFSQTILASLYGLLSCTALLIAWHACFLTQPYPWRVHLGRGTKLLLQVLPLMVLLFILLPRLGPLWSVPTVSSSATTGFSDSMAPGDIAQLSQSSELAFRVSFDNSPENSEPPKSAMYWRGLVLDQFDGRRWSSSETDMSSAVAIGREPDDVWDVEASGGELGYSIMLEPHNERWLFALATPVAVEGALTPIYTGNYLVKSRWPVDSRVQYRVRSDTQAVRDPSRLDTRTRQRNLQLPAVPRNPRTRDLVAGWNGLSPAQVINAALMFYQQQFQYTLQPPPLGSNSIDEFLFITRKGFCEHFAGSFVYLMRAAGVPARVVVGYQGGERSEVDDYWLVRQSSAHAWAEVWLEGQGWQRVDPTAVVAPDRVELGLREALTADEVSLAGGGNRILGDGDWRWLSTLSHRWDAVGYAWHRAVLSYDDQAQSGLLKRILGGTDPWRVAAATVLGGGGLLGLYGFFYWYRNRRPALPPEIRLLRQAERRLGVRRAANEPAGAWAERVAAEHPAKARSARQVARLFDTVVYAERREYLYKLQQAVRALPRKTHDQNL